MDWSLIVFAYNEAATIRLVVEQCAQFLEQTHSKDSEIIIVDDGSTDGTPDICRSLLRTVQNLKIIRHDVNLGIGAALKTGYKTASRDYVCAIPADGQFDVMELSQVPPFDDSLFYSFYRIEKKQYSLFRKILNTLNRLLNKFLLHINLRDVNWVKVYTKNQLLSVRFELDSSLVETEITHQLLRKGCTPVELPSVYHDRIAGISKGGNSKTIMKALKDFRKLYGHKAPASEDG